MRAAGKGQKRRSVFPHRARAAHGQLKAGLQLLDLYEDTNGYGNLHAHNIPTYWATLARKA